LFSFFAPNNKKGSGIFRSIQFSAFEAAYTLADNNFGTYEIPLTHGLQIRVILGGIASGTMRSIIETPLEYAKVFSILLNLKRLA
jgi:hypothetical protein